MQNISEDTEKISVNDKYFLNELVEKWDKETVEALLGCSMDNLQVEGEEKLELESRGVLDDTREIVSSAVIEYLERKAIQIESGDAIPSEIIDTLSLSRQLGSLEDRILSAIRSYIRRKSIEIREGKFKARRVKEIINLLQEIEQDSGELEKEWISMEF